MVAGANAEAGKAGNEAALGPFRTGTAEGSPETMRPRAAKAGCSAPAIRDKARTPARHLLKEEAFFKRGTILPSGSRDP